MSKLKSAFILLMLLVYLGASLAFYYMANTGVVQKLPIPPEEQETVPKLDISENLMAAESFVNSMRRENGHIDLYKVISGNTTSEFDNTNSEAVSYYLLWNAKKGDKEAFDAELGFLRDHMLHERGYMMWKLGENDTPIEDGQNIATDADLRTIKALLIAEEKWHDQNYTDMIDTLAEGMEELVVTSDSLLAPYGGILDEEPWHAEEIWLSYSDYGVYKALSDRRGEPWHTIYENMKTQTLGSQLKEGLYNSQLNEYREYGTMIDGGLYGLNSMWMMVRNAESDDPHLVNSANMSLAFYKEDFNQDWMLFGAYTSEGDPVSPMDNPWVYALVGRAAVALGDREFATTMMQKLVTKQDMDPGSPGYGGFPEGYANSTVAGQFTAQESILTMQDFMEAFNEDKTVTFEFKAKPKSSLNTSSN